jgi:hypothetical protein
MNFKNIYNSLMMTLYKSYLKDAILLLALSVAFMAPHFSQTHFVFGGDVVGFTFPMWAFIAKAVQSGELPLWIPFMASGYPSTQILSTLLYLPNILFVVFSFPLALTLIYLFHLWFAGFGAYLLASRNGIGRVGSLLSGCAFMLSAPLMVRIWAGHLGYVEAHAWIPWVALCGLSAIEKRNVFWISLAGGASCVLLFLTTFQILLYAFLLLGVPWAWQIVSNLVHYRRQMKLDTIRAIISLPLVGMLAMCLGAVAVLPSVELSGSIVRSSGLDYTAATASSYSPAGLLTLIVPDLFGLAWKGTESYIAGAYYVESMVYVGALTLALALLAIVKVKRREVKGALLLTCFALLIMMGRYTPFYELIFRFVPGVQLFRIPARAHAFVALGLAILAGHGFDFLVNASQKTIIDRISRALAIGCLLPGLLAVGMIFSPNVIRMNVIQTIASVSSSRLWGPSPGFEEIARLLSLQWVDLAIAFSRASLALLAGSICVRFLMSTSLRKRAVSLLILMVVIVDLWSYGARFLVPVSQSQVYASNDYLRLVTDTKSEFYRVYGGPLLPHNGGLIFGYFDVESDSNAILQRYWNFIAPLDQSKPKDAYAQQTFLPVFDDRVLYMLNVRYAALGSPVAGQGWKLLKHGYFDIVDVPSFISLKKREAWIYERIDPLPRAYLVGRCRNLDDASALVTVRATSFNPLAEVVLPPNQLCRNGSDGLIGTATITNYKANSIELDVIAEKPGYLVLSEIYHIGWEAYVNGKATDVLRANYTFRAVPIEAGVHKIRMVYRPIGFMIGLLISLASLVLIVLVNFIILRKIRQKKSSESCQQSLSSN